MPGCIDLSKNWTSISLPSKLIALYFFSDFSSEECSLFSSEIAESVAARVGLCPSIEAESSAVACISFIQENEEPKSKENNNFLFIIIKP